MTKNTGIPPCCISKINALFRCSNLFFFSLFSVALFLCGTMIMNRTINIENASKRMSDYSSCLLILTQLIGFNEIYIENKQKLQLPDEVEIDTLKQFKDYFIQRKNDKHSIASEQSSSYEMKMSENKDSNDSKTFWTCKHCTYDNSIDSSECQMCRLPSNVCVNFCATCYIFFDMICKGYLIIEIVRKKERFIKQ